MKRISCRGYTIIEVMIFLVVSSALLTSVLGMVSGRQERTRFTQSVEQFEQKLKDILNDVSTGYYPRAEDFKCTGSIAAGISFPAGSAEQGANTNCIFLGKALQFGNPSPSEYQIFTMVAAKDANNLADAKTQLLGGGNPGVIDKGQILADIDIVKVASLTDNSRNVTGVALVSEFSQRSVIDNSLSGNAGRINFYEVINNFNSNVGKAPPAMQPANNGVLLCLRQGSDGRRATITIGGNNQPQSTELKIDNWSPECPA